MATQASVAQPSSTAPRQNLLARHPLISSFIIAFAGSWLVELPLVLSKDLGIGLLHGSSPLLIWTLPVGVFLGPFLSAFIVTGISEGREGVGRLLRRIVLWRVGLRWYLFALVGIPVISLLGTIVLPGALASFQGLAPTIVPLILFNFAYIFFLGGGLNEEVGWRGFALPRLQSLHGPLVGSLILGPLWASWHLPLFFAPFWNTPPTILNMGLFLVRATCLTIVMTWLFNNTRGSVFMTILAHTANNTMYVLLPVLFSASIVGSHGGMLPFAISYATLSLVLVALTRGGWATNATAKMFSFRLQHTETAQTRYLRSRKAPNGEERPGLPPLALPFTLIHRSAWRNCLIIPDRVPFGLP
jgi:uncharacterized protein